MVFKAPRRLAAGMAAALLTLTLAACASTEASTDDGSDAGSGGEEVTLSLVAYSTPQAAYEKIIAAFQADRGGKNVKFKQSYGASGDQSRAVEAGLPADFVEFSLEPDMHRLVEAGIVAEDWNTDEYKGMVTDSVVVLVDPQGQPEGHQGLGRPDQAGRRGHHAQPVHLGRRPLERDGGLRRAARATASPRPTASSTSPTCSPTSPVQDDSARKSLQTFTGGKGDVLLSLRERGDLRPAEGRRTSTTSCPTRRS